MSAGNANVKHKPTDNIKENFANAITFPAQKSTAYSATVFNTNAIVESVFVTLVGQVQIVRVRH